MKDAEYASLASTIQSLTGINLSHYKTDQMRRRLDGYVLRTAPTGVDAFCDRLAREPQALEQLCDFLTINVSEFFRDPPLWDALRTVVLPQLLHERTSLRLWSVGCSHGAEAYSLALTLSEASASQNHQVLATDVDRIVVARARAGGPYSAAEVRNVPKPMLAASFRPSSEGFWIAPAMRRRVDFRRHDLFQAPPVAGATFDLIVCRNVAIYFNEGAKNVLHRSLAGALRPGGVLFIGATEFIGAPGKYGLESWRPGFYRKAPTPPALRRASDTRSGDHAAARH